MSRIKQTPITFIEKNGNKCCTKISTNTIDDIPKVVFIRVKMTLTPNFMSKTYVDEIIFIKNMFESFSNNYIKSIRDYDGDNYLFSMSVSEKGMKYGKKTHLRYDLFLKPNNEQTMEKQKNTLFKLSRVLNDKLIQLLNDKGFSLTD